MKDDTALTTPAKASAAKRRGLSYVVHLACLLLLLPGSLWAHAVLVRSTPADHTSIKPGPQTITLTYNSRIDAARSTLVLVRPDGTRQTLPLAPKSAVNILATQTDLSRSGDYQVQWQVLSVDGHITRGTLQFHVE